MEGVRVGREDPLEVAARQRLDVLLRERLPEPFLARAPDVAAARPLRVEEDPEIDPGVLEDPGERLRGALVARVERRVVADEPEQLDRLLPRVLHLELELLRP